MHYDSSRDGIWLFSNPSDVASLPKDAGPPSTDLVDLQGLGLVQREKGAYEPANLALSKQNTPNIISASSSGSSPSSSLESTLRNAQALNARSIQTNSALSVLQGSQTPSPGGKSERPASLKDMHESFISSVLGSIVYFLCHDHGFYPLNSRTLVLAAESCPASSSTTAEEEDPYTVVELATLDISLTSLGVLVIKAHGDHASGIRRLPSSFNLKTVDESPSPEVRLWLGPNGCPAKLYSVPGETRLQGSQLLSQYQESFLGTQPNAFNTLTIASWQSLCVEWLRERGLDVVALEAGGWLLVQVLGVYTPFSNVDFSTMPIPEQLAIVPWPALLCFQSSNCGTSDTDPSLASSIGNLDPLSFAEDWFMSRDERAGIALMREKQRQAEALSREQADLEARATQAHAFSPAALRRGSNAGTMYPTPPDAPNHHIGATPTFDGNISTPMNHNQSIVQEASGIATLQGVTDPDSDMWGSSTKKERPSSGIEFNENDDEHDTNDLFGDLGGDFFGTHITDDDFDFFDEPDILQMKDEAVSPAPMNLSLDHELKEMTDPHVLKDENSEFIDVKALQLPEDEPADDVMHGIVPQERGGDEAQAIHIQDDSHIETDTEEISHPSIIIPFTKEMIFQRLNQDSEPRVSEEHAHASGFDKIDFEHALSFVNEKYSTLGQFTVSSPRRRPRGRIVSGIPQTKYLTSRRKTHHDMVDFSKIGSMLGESTSQLPPSTKDTTLHSTESDCESQTSEQDDSSHTSDEPVEPPRYGQKRKWESDDRDDMSSSFNALAMESEPSANTPKSLSDFDIPLLDADPADWALDNYFTSPEPEVHYNALSELERIATAQILADQAVSGTLRPLGVSGRKSTTPIGVSADRQLIHSLTLATKSCMIDATTCTLRSFLDIQGIPISTQALRLPPRPTPNPRLANSLDGRSNNPFQIPPPQIEVRRSESKLSVLPASVNFWENLGLGPAKSSKNVVAVCVYPNIDGIAAAASTFLDQMRSVYESSRFGSHDRLASKDMSGLLPFTVEPVKRSTMHHLTVLKETVALLGRTLASLPVEEKNFVIYFVYPVDDNVLLVHICSAFQHLFNLYRKALSEKRVTASNELVLQLIPLDFIASPTSLAVPLPSSFFRLSMEVYDRCTDFNSTSSSPAIMLEQPLPKTIDFKLTVNPSDSLLQENTCLHISYAQSIDDRWITAAWTDNHGTRQMTASYCLGRKGEPISRPFSDVANEIWETTMDFISSKRIHWRIMIARVGVMESSELDFWTGLAFAESDAHVSLTLITVQTKPSLRLLPPSVSLSLNGNTAYSIVTPVSTPQASQLSILSPDTVTPPSREVLSVATPVEAPAEPDNDARLIDYTDQSWGAVLSHRLNNSNSLVVTNPALISGYLLKRGGTNIDDSPIVMEVNIVHTELVGNPRTFHESLLREVLGYYRGLGTLARVRGVVDSVNDVRPWHIAAAEKAVKTLYMLM